MGQEGLGGPLHPHPPARAELAQVLGHLIEPEEDLMRQGR